MLVISPPSAHQTSHSTHTHHSDEGREVATLSRTWVILRRHWLLGWYKLQGKRCKVLVGFSPGQRSLWVWVCTCADKNVCSGSGARVISTRDVRVMTNWLISADKSQSLLHHSDMTRHSRFSSQLMSREHRWDSSLSLPLTSAKIDSESLFPSTSPIITRFLLVLWNH